MGLESAGAERTGGQCVIACEKSTANERTFLYLYEEVNVAFRANVTYYV